MCTDGVKYTIEDRQPGKEPVSVTLTHAENYIFNVLQLCCVACCSRFQLSLRYFLVLARVLDVADVIHPVPQWLGASTQQVRPAFPSGKGLIRHIRVSIMGYLMGLFAARLPEQPRRSLSLRVEKVCVTKGTKGRYRWCFPNPVFRRTVGMSVPFSSMNAITNRLIGMEPPPSSLPSVANLDDDDGDRFVTRRSSMCVSIS